MGRYMILAGILLNSLLIIINRFVKHLPDWLQIPLLILGIGLMIGGLILTKTA